MDKVKFGRALGYGARHAMKSLASAVDAATSPDPNAPRGAAPAERVAVAERAAAGHFSPMRSSHTGDAQASVMQAVEGLRQISAAKKAVKKQAVAHVKRSFWAPLRSFSSVLWLQVTGSFFALFALTMGSAIVRHRDYFRLAAASPDGRKIYFYLLAFVVFAYFTVSNFVRANRRQKR